MPPHAEHLDPDDLALLALGETVDGIDEAHLEDCPQCRAELDGLTSVVRAARTVTPEDTPQAPRPEVWDAVRAELAEQHDDRAAEDSRTLVVPMKADARRRSALWLAAAAAVVGLAIGSVATGLIVAANDNGGNGGNVIAQTRLAALPAHSGSGAAEIVGTGTNRVLELDVSGLTRGKGYYEVWLLGDNGKRLVSLGLLDGHTARFPLPPGVDLKDYPIVDVSLEPADGNPAHSGDSIVRGTLAG